MFEVDQVLMQVKSEKTNFEVRAIVGLFDKTKMIVIELRCDELEWERADDGDSEVRLFKITELSSAIDALTSVLNLHFNFEYESELLAIDEVEI